MGFSSATSLASDVLVLSPIAVLVAIGLFLLHRRNTRKWPQAVFNSTVDTLALGVLTLIAVVTLVNPGGGGGVELVPFADLTASGWSRTGAYQNGGNIAMFLPLGVLLPFTLGGRLAGFPRVLAASGAVSVTVEILQYVLGTGRITSVDDVILNCTGAVLGSLLTWPWWRARRRRPERESSAPSALSATGGRSQQSLLESTSTRCVPLLGVLYSRGKRPCRIRPPRELSDPAPDRGERGSALLGHFVGAGDRCSSKDSAGGFL
ncbi:VanZ family protein [Nocardiopsis ganjiahuensis]|uniref:VanZ family protein n=1 Tax=Nocardiopsis ganjiahuensis TaxID=239984 RepID=UPI00034A829A|nr:VanZ family protein [Nocardiopsis ganjiahuensis]